MNLYADSGYPALERAGQTDRPIGYFVFDNGPQGQIVHIWKFEDAADRGRHWASVVANRDFVERFSGRFGPFVMTQEFKIMAAAPFGPHP